MSFMFSETNWTLQLEHRKSLTWCRHRWRTGPPLWHCGCPAGDEWFYQSRRVCGRGGSSGTERCRFHLNRQIESWRFAKKSCKLSEATMTASGQSLNDARHPSSDLWCFINAINLTHKFILNKCHSALLISINICALIGHGGWRCSETLRNKHSKSV